MERGRRDRHMSGMDSEGEVGFKDGVGMGVGGGKGREGQKCEG